MVDSSAQAAASAPRPGLRARKKAATMRHVQSTALSLFQEHGFDAVSIEQVAEAALVSPSTVYRYFGTKEGLVIHDEYDDRFRFQVEHCLARGLGLADAVARGLDDIWHDHFIQDQEMVVSRTRMCFDVRSVQAALSLVVNQEVDAIARVMAASGRWSFRTARIVASGVAWAIVGAMRNWYDDGFTTDPREGVDEVLAWLPALEATTAATDSRERRAR